MKRNSHTNNRHIVFAIFFSSIAAVCLCLCGCPQKSGYYNQKHIREDIQKVYVNFF